MRFLKAAIATMALVGSLVGVSARKHSNPLFSEKAPSDLVLQDMFTAFMKQYSKTYTHDEFSSRFETFKNNMEIIRQHNTQANATFTMGINEFADLTFDEFKAKYFGYKHRESEFIRSKNYHVISEEAAPTAIDWRTSNAVTGVKDQGQCGSCWAFSATGSIEGANVIQGKNALVSLSEQQLVDCSTSFGNNGCNGGLMDYAFEYVIKNGICSEASYGYKGVDGTCKTTCEAVAHISGYSDIPQGNEASLLNAVGTVGPVSVAIEADQQAFQFYSGGVFSASCGTNLDHGVLAVGYGTDAGQDYWLVKNSWGASWGESGYIRMIRNKNQCGIALSASYPKV